MKETRATVQAQSSSSTFEMHSFDFAELHKLECALQSVFHAVTPSDFDRIFLFVNHGSLGPLERIENLEEHFQQVRATLDLNITAPFFLCSFFLKWLRDASSFLRPNSQITIINVSSLCAVEPFANQSLYCIGKAARDMLIRNIAVEALEGVLQIKSLNYAPGPMDTDMQVELREQCSREETRKLFASLQIENKLVDPDHSARKLMNLLRENNFKSGSHIDFYDL